MIFREPVLRAVEVFAIVAPERKVNLDTTPLALQTQRPHFIEVSALYLLLT
jgi:hypothetical protein